MKDFPIKYHDGENPAIEKFIFEGLYEHMNKKTGFEHAPFMLSALDNGNIIAALSAYERNKRIYIAYLFVIESMRKKGIGKSILRRVEEEATRRGCTKIHVDSAGFQSPDFYRKLGYDQIGLIPDFFGGYDWVFFAKTL